MIQPSRKLQEVANYFILSANEAGRPITNKQLQKLSYYAQAWNLVFNKEPLFNDTIEAWVHGPAIRSLYSKYKKFGFTPITESPQKPSSLKSEQEQILSDVWQIYGKYDGDYLELLTHSEQPWIDARGNANNAERTSTIISNDAMKAYYSGIAQTVKV